VPEDLASVAGVDADTSDYPAQRLTARQYEKAVVLMAGHQQEAHALGLTIPDRVVERLTRTVGHMAGARPPQARMSVMEALDWLTTTPRFQDDAQTSPGPGGGKERLFQAVVNLYRQTGRELLLAQDPEVRTAVERSRMVEQLRAVPAQDRPRLETQMQRDFARTQTQRVRLYGLEGLGVQ
jgi:hypothetical protein